MLEPETQKKCFKRAVLISPEQRNESNSLTAPPPPPPPPPPPQSQARKVVVKRELDEDAAGMETPPIPGVVVKKEPTEEKVDPPMRRIIGKQTLEIAVKKESIVKQEPGIVKEEKPKSALKNKFSAREFYINQTAFINEVVPEPWHICWGALGTGIICVRSDTATASVSSASSSAAPTHEAAASLSSSSSSAPSQDAAAAGASVHVKSEPTDQEAESKSPTIPLDATICLLQTLAPQGRNGSLIGNYGTPKNLDIEKKTLHWSSQRSDRDGKRMGIIIDHHKAGGRVVVGVRSSAVGGAKTFRMLGQVSQMSQIETGRFVVQEGDYVINESGTPIMHKAIQFECLNDGLKRGVGLTGIRYPFPEKFGAVTWCSACCYKHPNLVLHFEELGANAITAFQPFTGKKPVRKRKAGMQPKKEAKHSAPEEQSAKRAKTEPTEPEESEADGATQASSQQDEDENESFFE